MTPKLKVWRDRVILVAVIWAVWALISTFIVQPFKIPSGSMEKTLGVGNRILVEKWSQDVKRGDVVVFSDDLNWDPQAPQTGWRKVVSDISTTTHLAAGGNHLVKRVIGLPGDTVSCSGSSDELKVNGVAIHENYLYPGTHGCTPTVDSGTWTIHVPAGHIWVMGDHRNDSADSRAHDDGTGRVGSIPLSSVTGRVVSVVWPLTSISGGHGAEAAFATVPAAKR